MFPLPPDVLLHIFSYLPLSNLCQLLKTTESRPSQSRQQELLNFYVKQVILSRIKYEHWQLILDTPSNYFALLCNREMNTDPIAKLHCVAYNSKQEYLSFESNNKDDFFEMNDDGEEIEFQTMRIYCPQWFHLLKEDDTRGQIKLIWREGDQTKRVLDDLLTIGYHCTKKVSGSAAEENSCPNCESYNRSIQIISKPFIRSSHHHQCIKRIHTHTPTSTAVVHAIKEDFAHSNNTKAIDPSYSPYYNTGTSLPASMRQKFNLYGQVPAVVETIQQQASRAIKLIRSKTSPLEKYMFMAQLRNNNTRLFYNLLNNHIEEFAPIIYTPTVGEACQKYSDIYPFLNSPGIPDGLYITLNDLPHLDEIIQGYKQRLGEIPDISVITDGSRILGLGDLGMNGMPISMGKLQLYVAGAGVDPRRTLPIVLDFGTNNPQYLTDEFYLGVRQKRPEDAEFYQALDT
ncbi:hypothetical protein BD770DRAFT_475226, partial [Pilaira anomala]